jgi:intein/homing endonuclease
MASIENRVLTKILESDSLTEALNSGLTEHHFMDQISKEIFKTLVHHWYNPNTSGSLPTFQRIHQMFPNFSLVTFQSDEEGMLRALIEDLKMRAYDSNVRGLADYFKELADYDPDVAVKALKSHLSEIEIKLSPSTSSRGIGIQEIISLAEDHYEGAQTGAIYGIPWPWPCLTNDTLGKRGGDFVVFYGRMKSLKCVCEGQRVMMPNGSYLPIEEVPESCKVPSFTEATGRIRMAKAKRVVSGTKDSVEVISESGLRLRTSKEHLYMVPGGGYKRIKDLKVGDYVATARYLPNWVPDKDQLTPEDAHLLGLLVGDGNYTRNEGQFTTMDPGILQSLQGHAERHNCELTNGGRPIEYRIRRKATEKSNEILAMLRTLGIHGSKGPKKRVPKAIFTSSRKSISAFIAGYLDTDGHIGDNVVNWGSSSQDLIGDLQHLLLRFGIRARASRTIHTNYGTLAYYLSIHTKKDLQVLNKVVGPYLSSKRKRKALIELSKVTGPTRVNTDPIPWTKELESAIISAKQDHEWPKSGISKMDRTKIFQSDRISRRLLTKLSKAFDSDELQSIANQDIAWERIRSITPIGKVACYDICIEDGQDPNFVVEGFVVHNTWVMLYCAAVDYLNHNKRVLVWSREMSRMKLGLRMATLLARVDYQLFKSGLLPPKVRESCFNVLRTLIKGDASRDLSGDFNKCTRDLLLLAGRDAPKTLEDLRKIVERFQPDVIYLDSFYHLDSARSEKLNVRWQRVAALAEDIKTFAEDVHLPVVAVHQASRMGEKTYGNTLADLADADVIAREADLIIRVLKPGKPHILDEEEYEAEFSKILNDMKVANSPGHRRTPMIKLGKDDKRASNARLMEKIASSSGLSRVGTELALVMGGNREGVLEAFIINAIPSYNFSLITDCPDMKDIKKWVKSDDEKDDQVPAKPKNQVAAASSEEYSKMLTNSGMKTAKG